MKSLIILLFAVLAVLPLCADETRPVGEMKTRWAADMNPDAPLPEYPRPSLVRENWTNLNGRWDYAIIDRGTGKPDKWEGKIVVPFAVESLLSGVQRFVGAERELWYRRSFDRPTAKAGERVMLRFGAVDWHATVWVNGTKLGEHKGGFDSFSFDVTEALKDGANELVVSVWDPTDAGPQPRGKQVSRPRGIWYTAVTGIWQTVWIEVVPERHLTRVSATGDPTSGELRINLETAGRDAGDAAPPTVVEVLDGTKVVATATQPAPSGVLKIRIPEPKAWSPGSPHLYGLRIRIGDDKVESYCALRSVGFTEDGHGFRRLILNGKPVFHFGPLDQGWWPDGLYTAPTDEALRYDIEMTRQMGFNMARKHVKVEPERWYYWADKLGLMVWQDMPSGFREGGKKAHLNNDHGNFRRELEAVIEAFRFHPSIVAWVPYNESWGQPEAEGTNQVLEWVKKTDPSRYVGGVSGWNDYGGGDWIDKHDYPGPAMHPPSAPRASVLGEFGGLGLPVEGHLWWNKKNWGYRTYKTKEELEKNYAGLMTKLVDLIPKGLAAAVYTQTTDCEGEVNGLMTYDRVPKIDPAWLKAKHAPIFQGRPQNESPPQPSKPE